MDVTIPQILRELIFADTDIGKKRNRKKKSYFKRFIEMITGQAYIQLIYSKFIVNVLYNILTIN